MGDLSRENRNYWRNQPASEIMHGISPIGVGLIEKYLPRVERTEVPDPDLLPWMRRIVELGAGTGEIAKQLSQRGHFDVKAVDINPVIEGTYGVFEGIKTLSGVVGDVTKWGDGTDGESILSLERVDGVIMQAILPSMLGKGGEEYKDVLDAASMWIAPNKYLFLNDIWAGDLFRSPMVKLVGGSAYEQARKLWSKRYELNQRAFGDLGLPKRGFIVGKPGTKGKNLELGGVEELRALHNSSWFERFAQHVDPIEVQLHLRRLGFTLIEEIHDFYSSRGDSRYLTPTSVQVWKKQSKFRYNHVAFGLDVNDPDWESEALNRYHELQKLCEEMNVCSFRIPYFALAFELAAMHAPDSQKANIKKLKRQLDYFAHV